MKISLGKQRQNKDFFRDINAERIHYQQTYTVRNIQGNFSGRRKIPSGNTIYKIKSTKIVSTWVNTYIFSYYSNSKGYWNFEKDCVQAIHVPYNHVSWENPEEFQNALSHLYYIFFAGQNDSEKLCHWKGLLEFMGDD